MSRTNYCHFLQRVLPNVLVLDLRESDVEDKRQTGLEIAVLLHVGELEATNERPPLQ